MYIQPNTSIKILRNVPLDNTYEHTIFFESLEAQALYFSSLKKYDLELYSYQRVKKGVCRVGIKADDLYDCNYMMFKNTAFGSKWFYAFIKSVEYVNNDCAEITFELDVMQTWHFDYSMDRCFVEREHSITDVIGEHIEPETLATGEYVFNKYEPILNMRDMVVCLSIVDVEGASVDGTLYDGIYGSSELWVYDSTDVQSINSKIAEYIQKPDAIISVYMFPKFLINTIPETHRLNYGANGSVNTVTLAPITSNDTLDGYKPKNRKLYTYPYNYYHVDNASGLDLNLRYEFFDNLTPVVQISGTITQPVTCILRPCSYKGVAPFSELTGYTSLNTESLQINNYPMCSWNTDAYKSWLAQNALPQAMNVVSNAYRASEYAMVHPFTFMGNTTEIGMITNLLTEHYNASIQADISKGNLNNGNVNVSTGKQQFYGGRCSISKQFAQIIDDYFTRFGYSVKRLKTPNRHSRPHWNYVKTIGCNITGSIPCDDMNRICKIYDNGITFWKNGSEIGNYSLDNSV